MTTQDPFGGSPQPPAVPPPPGQFAGAPNGAWPSQGTPAPAHLSFGAAVVRCFKNSVNFKDRAARSEYWWFVLFYAVVYGVALGVGAGVDESSTTGAVFAIISLVLLGLAVLLALPGTAVAARRLHDTGRSGWFQLISLIPFGSIVLIVWLASAGEPGPNKWGPPPGTAT